MWHRDNHCWDVLALQAWACGASLRQQQQEQEQGRLVESQPRYKRLLQQPQCCQQGAMAMHMGTSLAAALDSSQEAVAQVAEC